MNGGKRAGIGKSEKHIISLEVLITVDLEILSKKGNFFEKTPWVANGDKET